MGKFIKLFLLSIICLAGSANTQPVITFNTKTDFTTGTGPRSVSIEDLNGDGLQDLVVANSLSNSLSVLLNTTTPGAVTPSFSTKTDFTTGTGPLSVSIGDLNGDGQPDLAVANQNANSLSVLLNTTTPGASTPSFSIKTDFTTGSDPLSVSIKDLNGDGFPDLIATNLNSTSVSVLLNTTTPGASTPTFSTKTDFTTGSSPRSVSSEDLNGDGLPDLVVTNGPSATVSVLLNTTTPGAATPTFTSKTDFSTGTTPVSVSIGDLNGDGLPDLAIANRNSDNFSVLLNTTTPGASAPTFSAKTDFTTGSSPRSVSIEDLNGDGLPDLAVANGSSDNVSIFSNLTAPGASLPSFSTKIDFTAGTTPFSVSIKDLNGDGLPDLAVANDGSASVSVLFNTTNTGSPSVSFSTKTDFTTGSRPRSPASIDLNGDGLPDLVLTNWSANSVSVLLNTTTPGVTTPSFSAKTDFTTGTNPFSVNIDDLNGDGKPDLAVANTTSNSISVLLNTTTPGASAPSFSSKTDFSTGTDPRSVSIKDLNGDGLPDLAVANQNSDNVSVLLNTTIPGASIPSFSTKTDFTAGSGPYSGAIKDINGDGLPDLVVVNANSNNLSVFLNATTPGASVPSFSAKTDFTTGSGPYWVAIEDLNGDGKPDLAVVNVSSDNVSVLLNTTAPGVSTPTFSVKTDFGTGSQPRSVSIKDLNGDGKPDLAVVNYLSNTVSVLKNTTTTGASTPTFSTKVDFTTGSGPHHVSINDLNGEGKPDLAVSSDGLDKVSVLLNTTTSGTPADPTISGLIREADNTPIADVTVMFSNGGGTTTTTASGYYEKTVSSGWSGQATPSKTDWAFDPTAWIHTNVTSDQTDYDYTGTFLPCNLSSGVSPYSVSIGDINSDGKPDLAVANLSSNSVSILLNKTTPGATESCFAAKTDFITGSSPYSVSISDLNGDGLQDLAVVNRSSNSVSVFLNTTTPGASTPNFSSKTDFTTGSSPYSISIKDLNGDGAADLVVPNQNSNTISVFLNTTSPGSSTPSFSLKTDFITGSDPESVAIGDLNGDGKPDLAVANSQSSYLSVFLNTTSPGASTPSFSYNYVFSVGTIPRSVSIGDLNGDGKKDIALVNWGANNISVFINLTVPGATTPSFTVKTDFSTGNFPISVAIGDLNSDGMLDLAVANGSSNSVSELINTTNPGANTPSFSPKTDYTTGLNPSAVSIGDLNGDGLNDIAIANLGDHNVSVILNTKTLGNQAVFFNTKTDFITGSNPYAVSTGDFNGDGKSDLAVANYSSNSVSVFLNTTSPGMLIPSFTIKTDFASGNSPISVCIGDLNGDGNPDLATANYTSNNVSVFLNTMSPGGLIPSFSVKTDFITGNFPSSISLEDLNGDGIQDLAVTNYNSNSVSVLLNTTTPGATTPSFSPKTDFSTGNNPQRVTIGDLNNDGKPDLSVSNWNSNNVSLYINTTTPGATTPSFSAKTDIATGNFPLSNSISDLNGDGKSDLVVANWGSDNVSVYLNTTLPGATTLSFSAKTDFTTGDVPNSISTSDINRDGLLDLVVVNQVTSTVSVLLNTTPPGASTPSFSTRIDFATGSNPLSLTVSDLNGDGKLDLAVANSQSASVSVLINHTGTSLPPSYFNTKYDFTTNNSPRCVSIGDLNGDGIPDLVVANYFYTSVSVLLNTTTPGATTPSYSPKRNFTTGSNPRHVSIEDLNGDGKLDLAVANRGSNTVSVLLNTTSPGASIPTFSNKTDFSTGSVPLSVAIRDLNGDGLPDLVVTNAVSNNVSVRLNTTSPGASVPTFSARTDFNIGTQVTSVSIGDLNGDGMPDLVVTNSSSSYSVSVLLNTTTPGASTPSFSTRTDFNTATGSYSVSIRDLNGDGKEDLAVVNLFLGGQSVSVLLNTTAPGASTPSFTSKTDFAVGGNPYSGSIGDLNGDGLPDLVVANENDNNVSVLLNTTSPGASMPSFSVKSDYATGSAPYSVSISDLNGDGKLDLAVANSGSNSVSVLLNTIDFGTPSASFNAHSVFTTGNEPYFVSMRDLNGDGKPDLAVVNVGSTVSVLMNTTIPGSTTPSFSAKTDFTIGTDAQMSAIEDLNGDGKPDLVVSNWGNNNVSVFLNTTVPGSSTPSFSGKTDFTTGSHPLSISINDLNGDGKPDLIVTNETFTSPGLSVLINTTSPGASTPSFSARTDFIVGTGPSSVSVADLNGDGLPDITVANTGTFTISVLLNTTAPGASTPSFSARTDFSTGANSYPKTVSIGDLNGDGKPDLAVANLFTKNVSVFMNLTIPGGSTPTFSAKIDFFANLLSSPFFVSVGDLNGDGKPDMAVTNSTSKVSVFLNLTSPGASTPSFSIRNNFNTGFDNRSIALGDLNGDGKPDMALTNRNDDNVSVLLNSFATSFVGIYGDIKSYLQGPYSSNSMDLSLNTLGMLPLSQPFNGAPWNYNGTENVASFPAYVVDWVLIELRTGTSANTKITAQAAFIKSDGTIVDIDGTSKVGIMGVTPGNYYVVIRHKNHLPVMSSVPLSLSINNPTLYDFTTTQTKAYGSNPMKDLGDGNYGMIAGDIDADGNVDYPSDLLIHWVPKFGLDGYYSEDINLNGTVDYNGDLLIYWVPNFGLSSQVPEVVTAKPIKVINIIKESEE